MGLLIKDLTWSDGFESISADVRINRELFSEIGVNLKGKKEELVCSLPGHFIYPGFINAHDHLEMNLYSKLGSSHYKNYVEWANDIYKPSESPIREIEKVNIRDRLLWGGLKNLIAGVTTVVHHNPWHSSLGKKQFPLKVLKKMAWSHSLAFGKKIQHDFPVKKNIPFVIHAAEGVDEMAGLEIIKLNTLRLLKENTVLVHAIALNDETIKLLQDTQCSVIWCPASNMFLFGQTCPTTKLKGKIKIGLGSDSTLTGSPTILDEMRRALETGLTNSREICEMVTNSPAQIFNLPAPAIQVSQPADFFITPARDKDYFENLIQLNPSDITMVVVDGKIRTSEHNFGFLKNSFKINDTEKFTDIDVRSLKQRIQKKVGASILEANPLWQLIH
jgi:cytosine/adenosine deaminase-related metal-dependent hydrolase